MIRSRTINIGQGGPPNPVAFGLDFGIPTDVSKIHALPLIDPDRLATARNGGRDRLRGGRLPLDGVLERRPGGLDLSSMWQT